jgi:hypothetical protein
VQQVVIAKLAKELGIDPKYIQLEHSAAPRSRQRGLLASTGLDVMIVLIVDDGGAMADKLKDLTSSRSFWDGVNQDLAHQGEAPIDTSDAAVETEMECNTGFTLNNYTGSCDAVPYYCPKGTFAEAGTG